MGRSVFVGVWGWGGGGGTSGSEDLCCGPKTRGSRCQLGTAWKRNETSLLLVFGGSAHRGPQHAVCKGCCERAAAELVLPCRGGSRASSRMPGLPHAPSACHFRVENAIHATSSCWRYRHAFPFASPARSPWGAARLGGARSVAMHGRVERTICLSVCLNT